LLVETALWADRLTANDDHGPV